MTASGVHTTSLNTPARQILAQPCGRGGVFPRAGSPKSWLASPTSRRVASTNCSPGTGKLPLGNSRPPNRSPHRTETLFRGQLARGSERNPFQRCGYADRCVQSAANLSPSDRAEGEADPATEEHSQDPEKQRGRASDARERRGRQGFVPLANL